MARRGGKDDLYEGILDILASEIAVPLSEGDWKAVVRQLAISAHQVLMRHSWASALWATGVNIGPTRLRYVESVLRSFREGGFSPELTHHAYHVLEAPDRQAV